jgi:hypothetical protein
VRWVGRTNASGRVVGTAVTVGLQVGGLLMSTTVPTAS